MQEHKLIQLDMLMLLQIFLIFRATTAWQLGNLLEEKVVFMRVFF